jgi:hypothetical protein
LINPCLLIKYIQGTRDLLTRNCAITKIEPKSYLSLNEPVGGSKEAHVPNPAFKDELKLSVIGQQ